MRHVGSSVSHIVRFNRIQIRHNSTDQFGRKPMESVGEAGRAVGPIACGGVVWCFSSPFNEKIPPHRRLFPIGFCPKSPNTSKVTGWLAGWLKV